MFETKDKKAKKKTNLKQQRIKIVPIRKTKRSDFFKFYLRFHKLRTTSHFFFAKIVVESKIF